MPAAITPNQNRRMLEQTMEQGRHQGVFSTTSSLFSELCLNLSSVPLELSKCSTGTRQVFHGAGLAKTGGERKPQVPANRLPGASFSFSDGTHIQSLGAWNGQGHGVKTFDTHGVELSEERRQEAAVQKATRKCGERSHERVAVRLGHHDALIRLLPSNKYRPFLESPVTCIGEIRILQFWIAWELSTTRDSRPGPDPNTPDDP